MANRIITKLVSDWYTPEHEKKEEDPACYLIEPLTQSEYLKVNMHMKPAGDSAQVSDAGKVSVRMIPEEQALAIIFSKVTGWRGTYDENGKPIEFSVDRFRELAPWQDQYDVMQEILNRSSLTADEKKTSPSISPSELNQKTSTAKSASTTTTATTETPGHSKIPSD